MKFLFVIEQFYPYHDASAKVLKNLFSSNRFKNHEIHVLSIGNKNMVDDNLIIHELEYKDTLFYKTINKIQSGKFITNKKLIKLFANEINSICAKEKIDNVTFVLGNMNFLKIKLQDNIKVNYIFYDTFFENFFYKKEKTANIFKIQTKAFSNANIIFLLEEYRDIYLHYHPEFVEKFKNFYITAFYDNLIYKQKPIPGQLLHTGAFFKGLRDPIPFFEFLHYCEEHKISLKGITLGELPKSLKKIKIPTNLLVNSRVFGDEYCCLLSKSEALVLVDNCKECKQIPSKAYEYIGYNKKIIFFTEGNTNTCKLLESNNNVYKIDKKINQTILNGYCDFIKKENSDERKGLCCHYFFGGK